MGYPVIPAADGDLVVGNITSRTWNRLTVGSDGQVLQADSLGGTYGLKWSDTLGVKTFESDLTLTDVGPGIESTVFRTNASGATSIVNTDSAQTIYFGGHTAASSLQFNLTGSAATWIPSTTRSLAYSLNAARTFSILHGSTSFEVQAGSVRSYREHRFYSPNTVEYSTLTTDNAQDTFWTSTDSIHALYIGGGTQATSFVHWDDAGTASCWMMGGTSRPNVRINVRTGAIFDIQKNFASKFRISDTFIDTDLPLSLNVSDAATTSIANAAVYRHSTSATAGVGFGAGIEWQLEDGGGTNRTAAAWETLWEDPTPPNYDSAIRFRVITAGAYATNNLLYLSGGGLSGSYAVGINTNAPTAMLDVNGTFKARGNVGFNNLGPIAIPTAYTQTYSTAARTVTTPTSLAAFRPMGEIYIANNSTATTISNTGTWTQVQLTFTDGHQDSFDTPSAYELRYTGATTTPFHLGCTISIESGSANQAFRAVLVKNATVNGSQEYVSGTILTGGTIRSKTGSASDEVSTAIHIMSSLATNDTISLFVQNSTSTADLTVIDCNLFGMGITQDLADDVAELKQLVNALIDDGQAYGLLQ